MFRYTNCRYTKTPSVKLSMENLTPSVNHKRGVSVYGQFVYRGPSVLGKNPRSKFEIKGYSSNRGNRGAQDSRNRAWNNCRVWASSRSFVSSRREDHHFRLFRPSGRAPVAKYTTILQNMNDESIQLYFLKIVTIQLKKIIIHFVLFKILTYMYVKLCITTKKISFKIWQPKNIVFKKSQMSSDDLTLDSVQFL